VIDFLYAGHEVDVKGFVNFLERRGLRLIAITPAIASNFAIWFEVSSEEIARQHKKEWLDSKETKSGRD
jgi:hypothetical protein